MTNEELERENQELKERIEFLEKVISKGNAGNSSAYSAIRSAIVEKVYKTGMTDALNFLQYSLSHPL